MLAPGILPGWDRQLAEGGDPELGEDRGQPLGQIVTGIQAHVEEEVGGGSDFPGEPPDQALVLEPEVVDGAQVVLEQGEAPPGLLECGGKRTDDGTGAGAGDARKVVAGLVEDEHGPDQADAPDPSAFEDQIGTHRADSGGRIHRGVVLVEDDLGSIEGLLILGRPQKGLHLGHAPILPVSSPMWGAKGGWCGALHGADHPRFAPMAVTH